MNSNPARLEDLIIRPALESDAIFLAHLKKRVLVESPFLLETPSEAQNDPQNMVQQIRRLEKCGLLLVAEFNLDLVAMLSFGRSAFQKIQHRGGLMMIVRQDLRHQGIGRKLLESFVDWAKEDSTLERVDISVMSENEPALRLYKNAGFIFEGQRTRAYKFPDGSYRDEIFMGLPLR